MWLALLTPENIGIAIAVLSTVASGIAAITPSTTDGPKVQKVLDVINKVALNVNKAKNADDVRL